MSRLWQILRGATLSDAIVAVAALAVVIALLYPSLRARAFDDRVAAAIADVDAVASAARAARDLQGRWPTDAVPGEAPAELSGLGAAGVFTREGYALGWTTWEVVDSVVAPPEPGPPPAPGDAPRVPEQPRMLPLTRTIGAVSVHSGDSALLAELVEHYGQEASFVIDTVWLLPLPERGASSAPR